MRERERGERGGMRGTCWGFFTFWCPLWRHRVFHFWIIPLCNDKSGKNLLFCTNYDLVHFIHVAPHTFKISYHASSSCSSARIPIVYLCDVHPNMQHHIRRIKQKSVCASCCKSWTQKKKKSLFLNINAILHLWVAFFFSGCCYAALLLPKVTYM